MSMTGTTIKRAGLLAMVSAMVFSVSLWAVTLEAPQSPEGLQPIAPRGEAMPGLSAKLIDPEQKVQEQTATVEVKVMGIQLIDSAAVNEQPQQGQGHLHYQVDSGPVIATTVTKLSFHDLSVGSHKISVILVGNDHEPLGPRETLTVDIPSANADRAQR